MNQSNYEFYRKLSPANYPESNGELSRRQAQTPLPRFFRIRRVPRIPRAKLRRRAERKFLVPNSLVKVSFDLGDSAATETLPPVRL